MSMISGVFGLPDLSKILTNYIDPYLLATGAAVFAASDLPLT